MGLLEIPRFRPLEPLNLWIYEDPGVLYPSNPWTLEPQEKPVIPWDLKPVDYGNTRPWKASVNPGRPSIPRDPNTL